MFKVNMAEIMVWGGLDMFEATKTCLTLAVIGSSYIDKSTYHTLGEFHAVETVLDLSKPIFFQQCNEPHTCWILGKPTTGNILETSKRKPCWKSNVRWRP